MEEKDKSKMIQIPGMPHLMGMPVLSAVGMMSLLSARLNSEEKEKKSAEEMFRNKSSDGVVSEEGIQQAEDLCCVFCGIKETSVDKLKDHINMHFIKQIKKRKADEPEQMNIHKKMKKEDHLENENKTAESNDKRMKCNKCNI